MQVDVIASIGEARSDDFVHKTVIVIDVLRATSTLMTALANGCGGVIPVETVQQAKQLQEPGDLLGGERFCKKISGFDLGNSPFEYLNRELAGRRLIMTTTNGTRGIQKSRKASHVLAGALLNGTACAKAAAGFHRDVLILCAGTQDAFSWEDGLCAGMLVENIMRLTGESAAEVNDFGLAMLAGFRHVKHDLESALLSCANGKRLSKMGFRDDVCYCARTDVIDVVPVLKDGMMVPLSQ
jgi:2-phosphosulfolactate phosphatase